ncbi:hypothetical protein [Marivita sp. GX14005]|uniref:hypothetical protein n=1 Tax=Marivita sp. GX14005 TaxID=2942276 RepID=UPI0020194C26|nr:hypothetical protein [Marivita sp. GX14005]MCL3883218.1 hypothetical protein [Marivita sp. GX14005]
MLENEFDAIWNEQARHHPELTDAVRDRLRETIFYQRPLRPVDPGRCTFFPQKPRLPRWHPAAQAFLILQQLGHLRIIRETHEERLDPDKHRVLFDALNGGQKMTWTQVRKTLGLTSQDDTAAAEKVRLPDGHLRFCREATDAMVAEMRADVITYNEAVDRAPLLSGIDFTDSRPEKGVCILPYDNELDHMLSPGEAAELGIFDQEAMIERTKHLPRNKAWRFLPDAMEVFEEQKSFEDRQLHATGYLAKVVRGYAETLFDKQDVDGTERRHVWMLPGRMTALLRHRWGLNLGDHNRKNRDDHRHHAIDAAAVGVIDRGMIARLQKAAKQHGANALPRVLPAPPEPFPGFRDVVMDAIRDVRVSHRPRHSSTTANGSRPSSQNTPGALQKAGRYGLIRDLPENQEALLHAKKGKTAYVKRANVVDLSASQIPVVRDLALRAQLKEVAGKDGTLATNLAEWSTETGVKRVRLIEPLSGLRPLHDSSGQVFTHLRRAEIAYLDILEAPDGKWFAHDVDVWGLYLDTVRDWRTAYPDAKFIMRLYKGDTIQLFDWDKERKEIVFGANSIKVVRKLNNSPDNKNVVLFGSNEAGDLEKRHKDPEDDFEWDWPPFNRLKLRRARRVRIDELGKVHTIPHGKV